MPEKAPSIEEEGEFWERHGMAPPLPAIRSLTSPALRGLQVARDLFAPALDKAPLPKETSSLVVRAFENLCDRIYDQASAMITCLGAGFGDAAETLARTVIEASFNLLYIAAKDHEERLFAYFYDYLHEHEKRLEKWRSLEENKPKSLFAHRDVIKAINAHRQAAKGLIDFVNSMARGFGFKPPAELVAIHWPKFFSQRCEQIDRKADYLTSYHRLSASTHTGAEGTIHWLFGIYMDGIKPRLQIQEKLAVETVQYSAMMTRISAPSTPQ